MSTVIEKKTKRTGGLAQRILNPRVVPMLATVFVCLVCYMIPALTLYGFGSAYTFANMLTVYAPLGIIAVGMTMVIISGGIDLSVGGVVALCTVVIANLILKNHLHPIVCWAIALSIGTGVGLVTGVLVRYYRIEPFIATLAGLFFTRGLALILSGDKTIGMKHQFMDRMTDVHVKLGTAVIGIPVVVLLAVVFAGMYITFFTSFGRNLFAIGGNETAAHLMGLPVARTKLAVYMLSGFLAALAAIVSTISLPKGDPNTAYGWELNAIAASVIGGALMTGGAGNIFGTLIGVIILSIIMFSLDFQNLSSYYARILIGALMLLFVVMQRFISTTAYRKD